MMQSMLAAQAGWRVQPSSLNRPDSHDFIEKTIGNKCCSCARSTRKMHFDANECREQKLSRQVGRESIALGVKGN
jgi:hypothetical protein